MRKPSRVIKSTSTGGPAGPLRRRFPRCGRDEDETMGARQLGGAAGVRFGGVNTALYAFVVEKDRGP